jgi:hypothetical protein
VIVPRVQGHQHLAPLTHRDAQHRDVSAHRHSAALCISGLAIVINADMQVIGYTAIDVPGSIPQLSDAGLRHGYTKTTSSGICHVCE